MVHTIPANSVKSFGASLVPRLKIRSQSRGFEDVVLTAQQLQNLSTAIGYN